MIDARRLQHPVRPRILVVDDEPIVCNALAVLLEAAHYTPVTVLSGNRALLLLSQMHFDACVLDLRLPDTRGDVLFELASEIQPHLRSRTIFTTGDLSQRASKLLASCPGAALRKPYAPRDLIRLLDAVALGPMGAEHRQSA